MRLKLFVIALLLAVGGAAVFIAIGGLPQSAAAATSFLTGTAAIADVRDDVAATGSIASSTTWSLAFGAAPTTATSSDAAAAATQDGTWTVATVTAKVGDIVAKDQVLATAANPILTADVTAAKNDWTSAELQRRQAADGYDTAVAGGNTSAIRQARSSLLNARNAVASAHQKLLDLKATAARTKVVAPAAGVVTAVDVTAGADAPSGAAITVASTDYQVTAEVVESDIAAMRVQQPASVTVSALGAELSGTVTAIAPIASTASSGGVVSYAVTVALDQPPATLRAGMTADVTITTASASGVLAVPAAALRGSADNYTVLVLTAAGTPESRPVTVGLITSSLVEIKTGLSAGDVVVTGTNTTQRTTTGTGGGAGGGLVVPGGGGGGFGGRGANP